MAGLHAGVPSGPLPATTPAQQLLVGLQSPAHTHTHTALLPLSGQQQHGMPMGGGRFFSNRVLEQVGVDGRGQRAEEGKLGKKANGSIEQGAVGINPLSLEFEALRASGS